MNKTFQEVLHAYRHESSGTESSPPPSPDSSLRPIRLIVSRSVKNQASIPRKSANIISAIPASLVLDEAAKLAASVNGLSVRSFYLSTFAFLVVI